MKNISIIGLGYVGLSNALLLSQKDNVFAYDIDKSKIKKLKEKDSYIEESLFTKYLKNNDLNITFTDVFSEAIVSSEYSIICVPTNFSDQLQSFDTSILEDIIKKIVTFNKAIKIIIKSTVPIGFTSRIKKELSTDNIVFCPEFLREGNSLKDSLYPSRIIVGDTSNLGRDISNIFHRNCLKSNLAISYVSSMEAEAIKLFSNTYLALRIAFFNELDTFSELNKLDSKSIIEGVCLDNRIGNYYNNPSFGYGGYCLPKDTKQLNKNYESIPNNLISAIIKSNDTRKRFLAEQVLKYKPKKVGVYRLIMKQGSDNFREASITDVMYYLEMLNKEIKIIIYEPKVKNQTMYKNALIVNDLEKFKKESDIILANRVDNNLLDIMNKVYTRDVFHNN